MSGKSFVGIVLSGLLVGSLLPISEARAKPAQAKQSCVQCHEKITPGLVGQWRDSEHAEYEVQCLSCHAAQQADVDGFEHYGERIATIVSPKDCGLCHEKQTQEFAASHHAKAAEFIGSLDNFLGVAVEGAPAAVLGCQQCHGSVVELGKDGKVTPTSWPNTGIGRVNPDGSKGACTACHARHGFSAAQARRPENCGKCHMGPDHPQIEIYQESKHGILYEAHKQDLRIDQEKWVLGQDYTAAPTCASCHMSATPNQPVTHDAGARISWTLRPVISKKLPEWEKKKASMKDVCQQCHAVGFVDNFYTQFNEAVELYNNKFAAPAKAVMDELYAEKLLTPTPFDEKIEWTFFELWHHEGRRARHGAAMMGPDFVQWHGFYELAKHFYTKFLPQAEKLKPRISERCLAGELHKWQKGLSKEEMKSLLDFYKERYGEERRH